MSYSRGGIAAGSATNLGFSPQRGLSGINTADVQGAQHQLHAHNIVPVPDAPALAEISDRLDRLLNEASQNLDRISAAGNRSFGMTPEQEGNASVVANGPGIVDRISSQLTAMAHLQKATQEAVARIERLV